MVLWLFCIQSDPYNNNEFIEIQKHEIGLIIRKAKSLSGGKLKVICFLSSIKSSLMYLEMLKTNFDCLIMDISDMEKELMKLLPRLNQSHRILFYCTGHSARSSVQKTNSDEVIPPDKILLKLLDFDKVYEKCKTIFKPNIQTIDVETDIINEIQTLLLLKDFQAAYVSNEKIDGIASTNQITISQKVESYSKPITHVQEFSDIITSKTITPRQTLYDLYTNCVNIPYILPKSIPTLVENLIENNNIKHPIIILPQVLLDKENLINLWNTFVGVQQYKKLYSGKWKEYVSEECKSYKEYLFLVPMAEFYDIYLSRILVKSYPFTYQNVSNLRKLIGPRLNNTILFNQSINEQIEDNVFRKILETLPSTVRCLCIADICYSGTLFDLDYMYLHDTDEYLCCNNRLISQNIYSISACTDYEFSYKRKVGFLTSILCKHNNKIIETFILGEIPQLKFIYCSLNEEYTKMFLKYNIIYVPTLTFQTSMIKTPLWKYICNKLQSICF